MTSGVLGVLGLVATALLFSSIAARRGPASAFVAISWVPLAALLAVLAFRDRLGLSALVVLMEVIVASLVLVVTGAVVIARGRQQGPGGTSRLVVATILAASPLLLIAFEWVRSSGR